MKYLAGVVLVIFLVAMMLTVGAFDDASIRGRCFEDQSCWNCETMGNKICGKDIGNE